MSEKQKRLVDLRTMYYQKTQEILRLEGKIEALERDVQRTCDHEWEYDDSERGGRSWHQCRKCKKYR